MRSGPIWVFNSNIDSDQMADGMYILYIIHTINSCRVYIGTVLYRLLLEFLTGFQLVW